jgi:hypothetical protein
MCATVLSMRGSGMNQCANDERAVISCIREHTHYRRYGESAYASSTVYDGNRA